MALLCLLLPILPTSILGTYPPPPEPNTRPARPL
jgi:hypothetical protein